MEITTSGNTVTIKGNIKSVADYQEIRSTIDNIVFGGNNSITIYIVDSLSITSSVIGYFNKLVLKDKIDLSLKVGNQQLMELLNDLNLTSVFKATKA
jgi:hypothetical protein